jgi:serine/threonine protein phosphatase PrpC
MLGAKVTGAVTVVPVKTGALPTAMGFGLTHRGMVRDQNEDAILTDPSGQLWAVADGMGGYLHGSVASDIVIDCLEDIHDDHDPAAALEHQLRRANTLVRQKASQPGFGPMGSTVVALFISRAVAHLAWAGDARAYLLRGRRLRMLTRDHSVVQDQMDRGELTPEQAANHPESSVVTRAIGGAPDIDVDQIALPLTAGDRLLLCSDGLPRCVYEPVIEAAMLAAPTAEQACSALVREALDNGAPDNVSVIVVDMIGA